MSNAADLFAKALFRAGRSSTLTKLIPLVPEASTRRYFRLVLSDASTLVAVHEDRSTATTTMPLVVQMQGFLRRHGVSVPEIYFTDAEAGVMLQQDLGDVSLNQVLKENPHQADVYYQEAITRMFGWQRLGDDGKCPAFSLSFDREKLLFEFEFFITHTLLGYYRAKLTDAELVELRGEFTEVAEALAAPAQKVFTHRDYHSRNIMVHNGKQYIIDFQDARLGLVQYDLCSLLCDAYAPISPESRSSLLDFAFETGKEIHCQTRSEFDRYWTLSAFQRTVKAMGTFGRQAALGRTDFAAYLEPAWRTLNEITADDTKLRGLIKDLERLTDYVAQ